MLKNEVNVKGRVELSEAITYLQNLVTSLKKGKVCIENSDAHVTLEPQALVKLEVEARCKADGKESLEIELSWRKNDGEKSPISLKISSTEPAAPVTGSQEGEIE